MLLREDFERDLDGWQQEGAAEFSVAEDDPHGGARTARIVIGGASQPAYQKLIRYVDEQPSSRDEYRATVWVRTSGVTTDPGAYIVLEYFDGDKRLGVSHGGMATDATAHEWQKLQVEGVAPAGAKRVPDNDGGDANRSVPVHLEDGLLSDTLAPLSLAVYTSACDDDPPAPVQGLKAERDAGGKWTVTWQASPEPDLCYYRVHRGARADFNPSVENEIATTIATAFSDEKGEAGETFYKVVAVDQSGNAGR